jgi:hypothetical protein
MDEEKQERMCSFRSVTDHLRLREKIYVQNVQSFIHKKLYF